MPSVTVNSATGLQDALVVLARAPKTGWDTESAPRVPSVALTEAQRKSENKERALDPHQNRIVSIQASDGQHTYVFTNSATWPGLQGFLEDPEHLKIGQNLKFDWKQLKHHLGIAMTNIWDTMVAEQVITCGLNRPVSLLHVAKRRVGVTLNKSVVHTFAGVEDAEEVELTEDQLDYSAQDAEVLIPIHTSQLADPYFSRLRDVLDLEMELLPVLADMELTGFLIDRPAWLALLDEFQDARQQAALTYHDSLLPPALRALFQDWHADVSPLFDALDLFVGMEPSSTQQLRDVLNLRLRQDLAGASDPRLRSLSLPATSTKEFAKFRAKCRDLHLPIPDYIDPLIALRKWEKYQVSFGHNVLNKIALDGKLHPTFRQILVTGRLACVNPNLQQMPKRDKTAKKIRSCFLPDPGFSLIKADFSQIELRLLAEFAQEPKMIQAFLDGLDLHKRTASIMRRIPMDQVDDQMRTLYKSIGFGIPYGLTDAGLALRLDIPRQQARQYYSEYLDVFQSLKGWIAKQKYAGVRERMARTPLGRIRYLGYKITEDEEGEESIQQEDLTDFMTGRIERQSVNEPVQGCSADITKRALVETHKAYQKHGLGRLCLTVHDEIVGNVKPDRAEEGKAVMQRCMVEAGQQFLHTVPCVVDVSEGVAWS